MVIIAIFIAGSFQLFARAQYYMGLADAAATDALRQSELITQAQLRTDSLTAGLDSMVVLVRRHAIEDSLRNIELNRTRERARVLSDSLSTELASRLDSIQLTQLTDLVGSHEVEVNALQESLEIEKEGRRLEGLRADRASNVILQLEFQVNQLQQRDSLRVVEIEALRSATGGLSFSVKTGWLAGVCGIVLGYALASITTN